MTQQKLFIFLFPTKLYWWAFLHPNLRVCCFCRFFLRHQIKTFRFTFLFFWSSDISIYINPYYISSQMTFVFVNYKIPQEYYWWNIIDEEIDRIQTLIFQPIKDSRSWIESWFSFVLCPFYFNLILLGLQRLWKSKECFCIL